MSIAPGFFTQEHSIYLEKHTSMVLTGQEYLRARVEDFINEHPKVKPENVTRVRRDIDRAKTKADLLGIVWNYMLAHPSEGLKVLR